MTWVRGIRGATTADDNTEDGVGKATLELLERLVEANDIDVNEVAAAFFTTTDDLDALYPVLEDPEPEPPAFPMMPGLPPLPDTTPDDPGNVELPSASTALVVDFKPQKKRSKVRWLVRLTILFLLTGGSLGAAHYLGLVDLNGLIEEFRSRISSLIN